MAIGVAGGGSWGTTIAHLLGQNGHDVLLWMRSGEGAAEVNERHRNTRYLEDRPVSERVRATTDMKELTDQTRLIFCAVPLKGLREAAYRMGETAGGDHLLISCSKGLEREGNLRPTEVLKEETCVKKVGVLSGPNLAREIMEGRPCATVIASRFPEVIDGVTGAIMGPRFRVYASDDVVGVELAGALKNIYAVAAGLCDGLGYGANAKSALVTRALWEMTVYVARRGGRPLTMFGLAGVGDLMATCGSELSRNHQVGVRLAAGQSLERIGREMRQVAEGVNTTRVIHEHAREIGCEMPIADAMHAVLFEGVAPSDAVRHLMERPATFEQTGLVT